MDQLKDVPAFAEDADFKVRYETGDGAPLTRMADHTATGGWNPGLLDCV